MPYTFDQIFAADPNNPDMVASDAETLIFAPGDTTRTPLAITDATGVPLPNPIVTNDHGFGPAFISDLDRVVWEAAGLTGFFTSYEGLKEVAVSAQVAAEASATASAASAAGATAAAGLVGAPAGDAVNAAVQPGGAAYGSLTVGFATKDVQDTVETGRLSEAGLAQSTASAVHSEVSTSGSAAADYLAGEYASRAGLAAAVKPIVTIDDLPKTGLISAHRGGGGTGTGNVPVGPDNSLAGYRTAMMMGAHILDVDYRTTADGVMVAMHDWTVDRTTNGKGLVSDHVFSALPNVVPSKYVGSGWLDERVPSIEEIFIELGGKVVITVEAKEGVPAVKPLADLIKKHRLQRSVFINTNNVAVVTEIVAQGCLAHLWAHGDVTMIGPGIEAGATLIEVPANATTAVVNQCKAAVDDPTKNLRWFISGPINTRTQMKALTPGIMGHVTDALGMTNRPTGDAPLVKSIGPSLMAGKRGIGWHYTTLGAAGTEYPSLIPGEGLKFNIPATDSVGRRGIYLGDMSGTMPGTYTMTLKVKYTESTPNVGSIRMRIAATIPDSTGQDADTDGYVVAMYGSGRVALWSSPPGFGGGIQLFNNTTAAPMVVGNTYTLVFYVTPTTVRIHAPELGKDSGTIANTDWRGGHHYLWSSGSDAGQVRYLDLTRS